MAPAGGSSILDGETVIFSDMVALRSYNSLSLTSDGRYRLTLTDCHGQIGWGQMPSMHEEASQLETFGGARIPFVALPETLRFEVNGQVG